MHVKVYYISGMEARVHFGGSHQVLIPRDEYLHVATLEVECPYDAFHVCQNVDTFWHESDRGAKSITLSRWGQELVRTNRALRSMMVGDIVRDDEGRYFFCASIGWVEVFLGGDEHFSGSSEDRDDMVW